MRSERCACGGVIVAGSKEAIPQVVREHNRSLLHVKWRAMREIREAVEMEKGG